MYSFVINNKAYKIPSDSSELTLGQFIDVQNADSELSLLTALLGEVPVTSCEKKSDFDKLERELQGVYKLIDLLKTDVQNVAESGLLLLRPKSVNIMGLSIPVKENFVNTLPYWGYIHTKQAILNRVKLGDNEQFNATDLIPDILAHNMYSLVTKSPYNEAKADEFIEVIKEMKFIEAMQLGNFFLLQQKKLWSTSQKRWRIYLNLWRAKLVSKFLISTGRLIHSKRYQEAI